MKKQAEHNDAEDADSAQRPRITMTMDKNVIKRLKALAARNRRPYSVEAEIAIAEHLDREERRQGTRDS